MATHDAVNKFVEETGGWVASQLEACTRCGICADACHFYQGTGEPRYAPVWKMELFRRAYEQRFTPGGRLKLALGIEKRITDEDLTAHSVFLYEACTVCNKCALSCPMGIQLGPILHNVRTALAAAGMVPKDLLDSTRKQIEIGSPLGVTDDAWRERIEWISDEYEVEIPVDKKGADTLAVFTSIETMKFPTGLAAIARILNSAHENWTVSSAGREVVNFAFFVGDLDQTRELLGRVFNAAVGLGVKRIMISECGHSYDAFRWTAKNLMETPNVGITHILAVTHDFIWDGRIKLREGASEGGVVTFHDACKVQRRGGLIREPRDILSILAPKSFREMTPNKEQAQCCGGGGGVISITEADPMRYAAFGLKVNQMKAIGADSVCMSCSNCRLQFTQGVEHFGLKVKVRSLSEMVAEAILE